MPITLACACGRAMRIKDELAGRKIRCPDCRAVLAVPESHLEEVEEDEARDILLTPSPAQETGRRSPEREELRDSEAVQERRPYRPPPPKQAPRPAKLRSKARRRPRVTFEEGWFGSLNAGTIGGVLMMVIAAVWFVVGLAGGIIFFYPPILFVIGIIAFVKGLFSRD